MIAELYADGGVIGKNPSPYGGTYAWRAVDETGRPIVGNVKIVTPDEMLGPVTNNQTEMLAVLNALQTVPYDWAGTLYSDSAVTLGRVFQGYKWSNFPQWVHHLYQLQRDRLENWSQIKWVQLDGHPTAEQLKAGIGKRGNPVSIHNVWCDKACGALANKWLKEHLED
jgi:ribonuclease HI